jgi:hypothetical protein
MASYAYSMVALVLLAGCSDDAIATDHAGIYSVTSWTQNEAGCDEPGSSIADGKNAFFYVANQSFFGAEFIQAADCVDLSACRMEVDDNTINLSGYAFEEGSDSDGWTGTGYILGGGADSCSGNVFDDRLTIPADGEIQIERRSVFVENIPIDPDQGCDEEAAQKMAKTLPCSELETIRGTLAESL